MTMDATMAAAPPHELDGFDVESYATKYSGRNRINRLLFVARQSAALRHDAMDLLLQDLASSKNMKLYLEVAEAAANETTNIPERALTIDHTHVENVKRATAQQHERLEQELNSYKSTMIKESIRMGYNDLGNFFYELGDLSAALKSFAQARDYCTTDKHVIEMCLNVSKVGLHLRNYAHVKSYLTKLEQIEMARNDPILKTKLSSASGLVSMHEKNYREAALKFVDCQVDVGATFNEVLHAEDIALYGGICALATFQRHELRDKVINNAGFKAFLELLPWLRELINDFYSSNYATCLQSLEKMKSEMRLDVYLAEHVDTLCQEIRSRGIVQFFYPYLSVDLRQMAKTFNTPTEALEKEVCALIVAGKIDARMDSYEKVLYAYHPNKRSATYKRAFEVGRKYTAESRNLMLRMSLLKNGLVIRDAMDDDATSVSSRNEESVSSELLSLEELPALPELSPSASPKDLVKVHSELASHHNATRAILLHIYERLQRLETIVKTVQTDVIRIRSDISKETNGVREDVSQVQAQVSTLTSHLQDVTSLVDQFHQETETQRSAVVSLSTVVDEDSKRIEAVNEKVDNQRDEFDSRWNELTLKLEELPRALAALTTSSRAGDPFAGFTFRSAERDRVSLKQHLNRTEGVRHPAAGPYTDLQPFTIPDDMKAKIEGKIRQKEASQREADRRAALDLAEAYRRLQLAGYPRVTEIHMHVEQCRADLQRAFDAIRTSNLQLYACCESKIEKGEFSAVQRELQSLRQRLREMERSERDRATLRVRPEAAVVSPERAVKHGADALATRRGLLSIWNLEKFFGWSAAEMAARPSISVSAAQVPELRVALLELARDLTAMRQQWGKGVTPMPNAVVKTHLERLVTQLHDAYASTAQEPVDLDAVSRHVHQISRLLASELSQHVLQQLRQLLTSGDEGEIDGNRETDATVSALQQYATAMTANVVAGTSPQRRSDERRQLEQLRGEIAKLTENQHRLENAITDITSRTAAALAAHTRELAYVSSVSGALPVQQLTVVGPTSTTPAMLVGSSLGADADLREVVDQVMLLREQLLQMRAQFVTEDAFAELVRQWEQWRKERERMPIHGLVGQRMTGAPTSLSGVVGTLVRPPGALHQSSTNDLDAYLTLADGSDRPKSQPRLDPLQIHRIQRSDDASNNNGNPLRVTAAGGSSVTGGSGARVLGARGGALSKIQARAQGLRPRSGATTDTPNASSRR